MEFNPTSTKRRADRSRSGIGILEFLVAAAVGSMVVLAVMMIFVFSGRSFAAMGNYSDLDQQSRYSLDNMTKNIRTARSVYSYNTNFVILQDYGSNWLYYWWDPNDNLKRVYQYNYYNSSYHVETMMTNCTTMRFDFFQRTPNTNYGLYSPTYSLYQTTCKLVQLSWTCSRSILGTRMNTESVQSAKVVIRNQ